MSKNNKLSWIFDFHLFLLTHQDIHFVIVRRLSIKKNVISSSIPQMKLFPCLSLSSTLFTHIQKAHFSQFNLVEGYLDDKKKSKLHKTKLQDPRNICRGNLIFFGLPCSQVEERFTPIPTNLIKNLRVFISRGLSFIIFRIKFAKRPILCHTHFNGSIINTSGIWFWRKSNFYHVFALTQVSLNSLKMFLYLKSSGG